MVKRRSLLWILPGSCSRVRIRIDLIDEHTSWSWLLGWILSLLCISSCFCAFSWPYWMLIHSYFGHLKFHWLYFAWVEHWGYVHVHFFIFPVIFWTQDSSRDLVGSWSLEVHLQDDYKYLATVQFFFFYFLLSLSLSLSHPRLLGLFGRLFFLDPVNNSSPIFFVCSDSSSR